MLKTLERQRSLRKYHRIKTDESIRETIIESIENRHMGHWNKLHLSWILRFPFLKFILHIHLYKIHEDIRERMFTKTKKLKII